jgi:hypothetical protein
MYILIDYDNLPPLLKANGPRAIADHLQSRLITSFPSYFPGDIRFDVRFYGGWHARQALTPRGSRLLMEVQQYFPFVIRDVPNSRVLTINAFVAEGMISLPQQILPHTYRQRPENPRSSSVKNKRALNCLHNGCPADALASLFDTGACPVSSCSRSIGDLITKSEQKLVDTMLVADTIHLASVSERKIILVSSDDDMWPGMLSAMQLGATIFHVTTLPQSNARLYTGSFRSTYRTLGI